MIKSVLNKIPNFCLSHWLLRIPLAIIFLQQGFSKLPFSIEDAESWELPYLVWWFVVYGEIGAWYRITAQWYHGFKNSRHPNMGFLDSGSGRFTDKV